MKSEGKLYGRNEQREERRNKAKQGVGRKTKKICGLKTNVK